MTLTEQKRQQIEKIGIFNEQMGLPPVAGRIMGLLYVSDQPELTFDEIRETLQISKSATSNALNLLMQLNRLEYTTFPGDRKRYFRLKISKWREIIAGEIDRITELNTVLRDVVATRTKSTPDYNNSIAELADFLDYLRDELPALMQKWEQTRKT